MSNYTLHCGDVLAELAKMESNSVDAVLTDPPYGLGKTPDMAELMQQWISGHDSMVGSIRKGKQNCLANLASVPVINDSDNSEAGTDEEFVKLRISVVSLPVYSGNINFNDNIVTGEEEVNGPSMSFGFKDLLMNKVNAQLIKFFGNGNFYLRPVNGFTGCVGVCTCFSKGNDSIVRIPIRLTDDAFAQPQASADVVAFPTAKLRAVLALDMTGMTGELSITNGTSESDAVVTLHRSQFVGTFPAAGSLSTPLDPSGVSHVSDVANGTLSFNLFVHKNLLERIDNPIVSRNGFMNKSWDVVPGPAVWKELCRVAKPGAYLFAFGGTRTADLLSIAIRLGGWVKFDEISYHMGQGLPPIIDWVYGQGFNKVGLFQNREDFQALGIAETWAGWGGALKPAHEIILCFRKPVDGTYANNALKWGTGGLNIDGARVGTDARPLRGAHASRPTDGTASCFDMGSAYALGETTLGRFPANVIHDGSDAIKAEFDKAGERTSGTKRSGTYQYSGRRGGIMGEVVPRVVRNDIPGDTGSAARFFAVCPPDNPPFVYSAKASRSERNAGVEDANHHPCVKPLSLCRYIASLILPPEAYRDTATILIPYAGVSSEVVGAMQAGWRNIIGIEREAEYCEINRRRFEHWQRIQAEAYTRQPSLLEVA